MNPLLIIFLIALPIAALAFLLWLLLTPAGKRLNQASKSSVVFSGHIPKPLDPEVEGAIKSLQDCAQVLQKTFDPSLESQFVAALQTLRDNNIKWAFNTSAATVRLQMGEAIEMAMPANFQSPNTYQSIFKTVNQLNIFTSQEFYDRSLQALELNPSPKTKQFALKVGRYHYGKLRGGKITIYDEQAIQNDISTRT